eukprot:g6151.t1
MSSKNKKDDEYDEYSSEYDEDEVVVVDDKVKNGDDDVKRNVEEDTDAAGVEKSVATTASVEKNVVDAASAEENNSARREATGKAARAALEAARRCEQIVVESEASVVEAQKVASEIAKRAAEAAAKAEAERKRLEEEAAKHRELEKKAHAAWQTAEGTVGAMKLKTLGDAHRAAVIARERAEKAAAKAAEEALEKAAEERRASMAAQIAIRERGVKERADLKEEASLREADETTAFDRAYRGEDKREERLRQELEMKTKKLKQLDEESELLSRTLKEDMELEEQYRQELLAWRREKEEIAMEYGQKQEQTKKRKRGGYRSPLRRERAMRRGSRSPERSRNRNEMGQIIDSNGNIVLEGTLKAQQIMKKEAEEEKARTRAGKQILVLEQQVQLNAQLRASCMKLNRQVDQMMLKGQMRDFQARRQRSALGSMDSLRRKIKSTDNKIRLLLAEAAELEEEARYFNRMLDDKGDEDETRRLANLSSSTSSIIGEVDLLKAAQPTWRERVLRQVDHDAELKRVKDRLMIESRSIESQYKHVEECVMEFELKVAPERKRYEKLKRDLQDLRDEWNALHHAAHISKKMRQLRVDAKMKLVKMETMNRKYMKELKLRKKGITPDWVNNRPKTPREIQQMSRSVEATQMMIETENSEKELKIERIDEQIEKCEEACEKLREEIINTDAQIEEQKNEIHRVKIKIRELKDATQKAKEEKKKEENPTTEEKEGEMEEKGKVSIEKEEQDQEEDKNADEEEDEKNRNEEEKNKEKEEESRIEEEQETS